MDCFVALLLAMTETNVFVPSLRAPFFVPSLRAPAKQSIAVVERKNGLLRRFASRNDGSERFCAVIAGAVFCAVIASAVFLCRHCERQRSNPSPSWKERMDCFVASLLAMTETNVFCAVIASAVFLCRHCERQRSNPSPSRKERMDCFVASLLAMTETNVFLPSLRAPFFVPSLRAPAKQSIAVAERKNGLLRRFASRNDGNELARKRYPGGCALAVAPACRLRSCGLPAFVPSLRAPAKQSIANAERMEWIASSLRF